MGQRYSLSLNTKQFYPYKGNKEVYRFGLNKQKELIRRRMKFYFSIPSRCKMNEYSLAVSIRSWVLPDPPP